MRKAERQIRRMPEAKSILVSGIAKIKKGYKV